MKRYFGSQKPRFTDTGMRLHFEAPPRSRWREAFRALAPVVAPLLFVVGLLSVAVISSNNARRNFDAACLARGGVPQQTYPGGSVCIDKRALR